MKKQAEQGVRQKGNPVKEGVVTLFAGDSFVSLRYPNKPETLCIPQGCVGLFHADTQEVSVVRDDAQAVRRWFNKHGVDNVTRPNH